MPENDRRIKTLAFVSKTGGAPCGHCRQIISEFGTPQTKIIGFSTNTNETVVTTLADIFPYSMKTGKDALK